ncbi:hypothetical protein MGYG_06060 [Nannizzia gypsea CBS 118893]|uniref:Methyltransferase type 12 domain-containing protein n=1 Tax=Arthroderma gypseum (strain ATCC MYA-4604 / CBS 118893) TaxID=535722 RepID=E4V0C5_ARTGP|nr:hypothetical protein MGYG_06060 [Nannizzia gypsea CBS 118893]EFR03062.1 hypothetical protein MGYG_06060 [Nannizzia gypsea CBS 118893]
MADTQDKYVFGRDKQESKRLNSQHNLLLKVTDNTLIHPSIPQESVHSVADVGTGTGIWLRDVSKLLETTNPKCYYHAFDISADQFPEQPGNIQFEVQDITLPFSKEHWHRYDVVHVRLLVAALEEVDYKAAVTNLSAILKPGGFLQWEEIDEESYKSADNPVIWEIQRCFSLALKAEGKCFAASAKVYEECKAAGFLDVVRLAYRSDSKPDIRHDVDKRLADIMGSLYARLLLRSGQAADEDAASKQAEELVKQHWSLCAEGKSPPLTVMRVVAQKPLDE